MLYVKCVTVQSVLFFFAEYLYIFNFLFLIAFAIYENLLK